MAKYKVMMSCGHVEEIQLFGKMSDRDRKIAWLEEHGVCSECRKAQKERAHAEATAKAAEKAAEENLPELTGTEKQINWALAIRAEKLAEVDGLKAKGLKEVEAQGIKNVLASKTESRFWIDNRGCDLKAIIRTCNLADAIKAEVENLKKAAEEKVETEINNAVATEEKVEVEKEDAVSVETMEEKVTEIAENVEEKTEPAKFEVGKCYAEVIANSIEVALLTYQCVGRTENSVTFKSLDNDDELRDNLIVKNDEKGEYIEFLKSYEDYEEMCKKYEEESRKFSEALGLKYEPVEMVIDEKTHKTLGVKINNPFAEEETEKIEEDASKVETEEVKPAESKKGGLNKTATNKGYLLGRLWALAAYTNKKALVQQNSGSFSRVKILADDYCEDKFLLALDTPKFYFSNVLDKTFNALAIIKNSDITEQVHFIEGVFQGDYPERLQLEEQNNFWLGYYHQRGALEDYYEIMYDDSAPKKTTATNKFSGVEKVLDSSREVIDDLKDED